MSEDIEVKAKLTAVNEASPIIKQFVRDLKALDAALTKTFSTNLGTELFRSLKRTADEHRQISDNIRGQAASLGRAGDAQRKINAEYAKAGRLSQAAARAQARRQADALSFDRQRLSFALRMDRQRQREAAQADREHRASMSRMSRERAAAGRSGWSRGREAFDRGSSGVGRATRAGGTAAAVMAGSTAVAARKVILSEIAVDAAEINTRIYGKLSKQQAANLRQNWAGPESINLGSTQKELLRAYTEAIKVGIPVDGAKEFAQIATQVSEAWEMQFDEVVDVLGVTNQLLTSDGSPFDIRKLKSVANNIQYLASAQATTPERIIAFMKHGAGAGKLLGMSPEAANAIGSAATSLGLRPEKAGNAFGYMAGRIVELPRLIKNGGKDGRSAGEVVRALGYGSAQNMTRMQQGNPDDFVVDMLERFSKIRDPKKRNELLRWFFGREWLDEGGRMVTGIDTVKEAHRLQKEGRNVDAIGDVWKLHTQKLLFMFKQIRAGFLNVLGEAGVLLNPVVTQIKDYFLNWVSIIRQGGLKDRLSAVGQGLLDGFGHRSLSELMEAWFGKPGQGDAGAIKAWGDAARGFAAGLADVGRAIKALFNALPGGGDVEGIGRWTARILGFSTAARFAAPGFELPKDFALAITSLGGALLSFLMYRNLLSAIAGGGAVAAGAAGGAAIPVILAALAAGVTISVLVTNWSEIFGWLKGGPASKFLRGDLSGRSEEYDRDQRAIQERLDGARSRGWGWFRSLFSVGSAQASERRATVAEFTRSSIQLRDALDGLGDKVQKASFDSPVARSTSTSFGATGAAASSSFSAPATSAATIGNGAVNSYGLTRRGILGGSAAASFGAKAPGIMERLQRDLGLTREQAAGILGNIGHESGGFRFHEEVGKGGRGGAGWAQWTGSRRREFEAWAASKGLDPRSDDANYGFLVHELRTKETKALAALKAQSTVEGATVAFERHYERAGVKAYGSRLAYAQAAMNGSSNATALLGAGLIPVKTSSGGTALMDPAKGFGQAFAGGKTSNGTLSLAQAIMGSSIGGNVARFTGFNDSFHVGRNSKHPLGLAADFTLKDPTRSAEEAEKLRNLIRGAGLRDGQYRVIDEYLNRSGHATGGHLHAQFQDEAAAAQFAAHRAKTLAAQTPQGLASAIPFTPPPVKPGGMFDPNFGQGVRSFNPRITINGGNQSPEEISAQVQRRLQQAMTWRTHDTETELT